MKRTPTTRIVKVCAVCISALLVLQLAACARPYGEDPTLPVVAAALAAQPEADPPETGEVEQQAQDAAGLYGEAPPAAQEETEPGDSPDVNPEEPEGNDGDAGGIEEPAEQPEHGPEQEGPGQQDPVNDTPDGDPEGGGEDETDTVNKEEEDDEEPEDDEDDEDDDPAAVNALLDRAPMHIKDLYAWLHEEGIYSTTEAERTILTGFDLSFTGADGAPVEVPTAESYVRMFFEFVLPEPLRENMVAGDYYTFLLPNELQVTQAVSLPLVDDDNGEEMALLTIDPGTGLVTITFNGAVQTYNDIDLEAVISGKLDPEALDGAGDTVIRIPYEDDALGVEITIRPLAESPLDKRGDFTRQFNPDGIVWHVDVNKTLESLTSVTLAESWPAYTSLETVEVYEVKLDIHGNVIDGSETPYTGAYSVDENGNITLPQLGCALRVVYITSIDLDAVDEDGSTSVSFPNTATLHAAELAKSVSATANPVGRYGTALYKDVYNVNNVAQEVTWHVQYNWNERSLNSPTLTDLYGAPGMSLKDGSLAIYPVYFAANGGYTVDTENPLTQDDDYTLEVTYDAETGEETGFVLRFANGLDYAVLIEYTTDISGVVGSEGAAFANAISDDDERYSNGGGTIKQATIDKGYTNLNYENKTVDVRLQFNRHGYTILNPVITDTWKQGMEYIPGTLEISGGGEYEENEQYTLEVDQENRSFTLTFLGQPPTVSETLTITYQMRFDSQVQALGGRLENTAAVEWTAEDGKTHRHTDSANLTLTKTEQQNGAKGASYNAEDKTITWNLSLGYASTSLKNAWVEDTIPEGQSYVPGSLQCYPYSVDAGGGLNVDRENPYDMAALGITWLEPADNGGTLRINLPGVEGRYYFEFKTSLEGYIVRDTYANTARFYNEAHELYEQPLTASIQIPNGGAVAGKRGLDDGENGLWWLVTVNSSQSTLYNLEMLDEPSENQVIELDSLAVYKTTVAEDGTVTPTDEALTRGEEYTAAYTLDDDGQWRLRVSFLQQPVTQAYLVAYRVQLVTEKETGNEILTNNVTITGENEEIVPGSSGGKMEVDVSTATGVIRGTRGTLGVLKRCAVSGRPLSGAVFQVYDAAGNPLGSPLETDENGKASMSGLLYGSYTIRELTSPEGYRLTGDLPEGVELTLTRESAGADYYEEYTNQPTSVTLQKQDENGAPLANAVFTLERQDDETGRWAAYETEASLTTGREGVITLHALPEGTYRLTEVEAPGGYRLTGQLVHEFTLAADESGEIEPLVITAQNQPTSVSLQKRDENGGPLPGAEFILEAYSEAAGEWQRYETAQSLVTDEDGRISLTALPVGKYRLIEATAPQGYRPDTTPLAFTLQPGEDGDIPPLALEFTNYPTEVTLQKQSDSGVALAGARFGLELYDNEAGAWQPYDTGGEIVTGLDGTVTLTHLPAGTYRVTELKAPLGYVLNPFAGYEFTLAPDAEQNGDIFPLTLEPVVNAPTKVTVLKADEDGTPLAGAEFMLERRVETEPEPGEAGEDGGEADDQEQDAPDAEPPEESGGENDRWSVVEYPEPLVSGEDGAFTLTGLPAGTYRLTETAAPAGYFAAAQPVEFTLAPDEDGVIQPLTVGPVVNVLSQASVTKINPDGETLAGCEFILEQLVPAGPEAEDDPPAARALAEDPAEGSWQRILQDESLVTGEDGLVTVAGLAPGTYRFIEVVSPEGYTIDQTPLPFTLTAADTALVDVGRHANTPIETEPKTPPPVDPVPNPGPAGSGGTGVLGTPGGGGTAITGTPGGGTGTAGIRRSSPGSTAGSASRGIGGDGSGYTGSTGGRVQTGSGNAALPLAVLGGAAAFLLAAVLYHKRRRGNGKR